MSVDITNWPEAEEYFAGIATDEVILTAKDGVLYDLEQTRESEDGEKLYIGRAGSDGIEFIYRKGIPGVWAYYPIDNEFRQLADSLHSFVRGWQGGHIKV